MKSIRHKSVLGLAVGERCLMAAEVVLIKDRPQVTRVAELQYPPGVTPLDTEKFGALFNAFRQEQGFTARVAVVGLAAKWVVVRTKEVPPASQASLIGLLRLGAEAEFSSELKNLVFDFAGDATDSSAKSVLLLATQRKYVDAAVSVCEAARCRAVAVTSSALALGEITGRGDASNALVLVVGPRSAELTAHHGTAISSIRHLRGPDPVAPFVSELRRAVSTMSSPGPSSPSSTTSSKSTRELILWGGTELDPATLGQQLNLPVRNGDLPSLGVDTSPAVNGEGPRFAAAVALALSGTSGDLVVDFLHSRLSPPRTEVIPRWAYLAAGALLLLIVLSIAAFHGLHTEQARVAALQAELTARQPAIDAAGAFVSKVKLAAQWHSVDPRYLACLRDVTLAIPEDQQTYATSLILRETKPQADAGTAAKQNPDPTTLTGLLSGKTTEQPRVEQIIDRMAHMPAFADPKLGGSTESSRHEVQFSITFTFVPAKPRIVKK